MNDESHEMPEVMSVIDPDGIDCVIAAGDASDIAAIRAWLLELPDTSYGQVFIEVFSPIQIEALPLPPHVGATWLCRESLSDPRRPGLAPERGESLARAVDAWFDEWLWAETDSPRHFELWMGARSSVAMQAYWAQLDARLAKRWPAVQQHATHAS